MRKGPDCDYDKWNISVVIGDTDIHVMTPIERSEDTNEGFLKVPLCNKDPYTHDEWHNS